MDAPPSGATCPPTAGIPHNHRSFWSLHTAPPPAPPRKAQHCRVASVTFHWLSWSGNHVCRVTTAGVQEPPGDGPAPRPPNPSCAPSFLPTWPLARVLQKPDGGTREQPPGPAHHQELVLLGPSRGRSFRRMSAKQPSWSPSQQSLPLPAVLRFDLPHPASKGNNLPQINKRALSLGCCFESCRSCPQPCLAAPTHSPEGGLEVYGGKEAWSVDRQASSLSRRAWGSPGSELLPPQSVTATAPCQEAPGLRGGEGLTTTLSHRHVDPPWGGPRAHGQLPPPLVAPPGALAPGLERPPPGPQGPALVSQHCDTLVSTLVMSEQSGSPLVSGAVEMAEGGAASGLTEAPAGVARRALQLRPGEGPSKQRHQCKHAKDDRGQAVGEGGPAAHTCALKVRPPLGKGQEPRDLRRGETEVKGRQRPRLGVPPGGGDVRTQGPRKGLCPPSSISLEWTEGP